MQTPVLVLNASYEPINICGARRALVLVLKGVARTEEEQGAMLHAARVRMPMPSVIRLLEIGGFRTRRGLCRGRIFCFGTGIRASTAELCCIRRSLRWTMCSLDRAVGCRLGKTWWRAAIAAIAGRAISFCMS